MGTRYGLGLPSFWLLATVTEATAQALVLAIPGNRSCDGAGENKREMLRVNFDEFQNWPLPEVHSDNVSSSGELPRGCQESRDGITGFRRNRDEWLPVNWMHQIRYLHSTRISRFYGLFFSRAAAGRHQRRAQY